MIKELAFLIKKELVLEWRQKYAIGGVLLYVLSTIYIVYASFTQVDVQPDANVWNMLFWIIVLFTSINAITKSFVQESGKRQLYYYTLTSPTAMILSKMLYNSLILLLLNLLSYFAFRFVAGDPLRDAFPFFMALFLGSIGFSITFTFLSAIAVKANNSSTLMAILAFPVVIPILLTLIKLSSKALLLLPQTNIRKDILILIAIDLILLAVTFVLFPYLWRD